MSLKESLGAQVGMLLRLYGVDNGILFLQEIKKEIKKAKTTQTIKQIQDITDILSGWDIETVEEFKQTRLDPFNASLKHRVKPKTIKEVKGAILNKKLNNPLLSYN